MMMMMMMMLVMKWKQIDDKYIENDLKKMFTKPRPSWRHQLTHLSQPTQDDLQLEMMLFAWVNNSHFQDKKPQLAAIFEV